jgi:hypothetical protein
VSTARAALILTLIVIAGALTYGGPRLELPRPRLLPVGSFPREIGEWTMVEERKVSADVQKALPTAVILDRDYRNSRGRLVSLLLVTARELKDIHSPAVCLPGSGWETVSDKLVEQDAFRITARVMQARDRQFLVWFWYPSVPFPEPTHPFVRRLYRWRLTAPGTYRPDTLADLSSSLMVRVIAPDVKGALDDVRAFIHDLEPVLRNLIARPGAAPGDRRHGRDQRSSPGEPLGGD